MALHWCNCGVSDNTEAANMHLQYMRSPNSDGAVRQSNIDWFKS